MTSAEEFLTSRGAELTPLSRTLMVAAGLRRGLAVELAKKGSGIFVSDGLRRYSFNRGVTNFNTLLARRVCRHRDVTSKLLRAMGEPMAQTALFGAHEVDRAWQWAQSITPVAVIGAGQPAATSIGTREEFQAAFAQFEDPIVVEHDPPGDRYRVLVVAGKVVAAARVRPSREPIAVSELPEAYARAGTGAVRQIPGLRIAEVDLTAPPSEGQPPTVTRLSATVNITSYSMEEGDETDVADSILEAFFPAPESH